MLAVLAINKQLVIDKADTPLDIRRKIKTLAFAMRKFHDVYNLPTITLPIEHIFSDGVYMRRCYHPAGILVVGKIIRQAHIFLLLEGQLTIVTEDTGSKMYVAPAIINVPAGIQKVALSHTDCQIATIHSITAGVGYDISDVPLLEAGIVAESYTVIGQEDPAIDELNLLDLYQAEQQVGV